MRTLKLILLVLAAVCFLVAALGFNVGYDQSRGGRRGFSLVALGLLFWELVALIDRAQAG